MGLLDEAIKEHLDLKRRRGADPAEVERAEREALGPVRRNREPADSFEPADETDEEGGFAYDHAEEQDWAHDSSPEPVPGDDLAEPVFDDAGLDPAPAPRSSPAGGAPAPGEAEPFAEEPEPFADEPESSSRARGWAAHQDEAAPEPFPTASPPPRRLDDVGGGETVEYNVPDALAAGDEAKHASGDEDGEDVLEETPEFLQDTPDHDRLWFEQRPPRDFDFDG